MAPAVICGVGVGCHVWARSGMANSVTVATPKADAVSLQLMLTFLECFTTPVHLAGKTHSRPQAPAASLGWRQPTRAPRPKGRVVWHPWKGLGFLLSQRMAPHPGKSTEKDTPMLTISNIEALLDPDPLRLPRIDGQRIGFRLKGKANERELCPRTPEIR